MLIWNAATENTVHKRRAKKLHDVVKIDKDNKDESAIALCFDCIQNLPLLHVSIQEIFCTCQL